MTTDRESTSTHPATGVRTDEPPRGSLRRSPLLAAEFPRWTRAAWSWLHAVSYHSDRDGDGRRFGRAVHAMSMLLPCDVCGHHMREYLATHVPPNDSAGTPSPGEAPHGGWGAYLVGLHNDINTRAGKPTVPERSVRMAYLCDYPVPGVDWDDAKFASFWEFVAAATAIVSMRLHVHNTGPVRDVHDYTKALWEFVVSGVEATRTKHHGGVVTEHLGTVCGGSTNPLPRPRDVLLAVHGVYTQCYGTGGIGVADHGSQRCTDEARAWAWAVVGPVAPILLGESDWASLAPGTEDPHRTLFEDYKELRGRAVPGSLVDTARPGPFDVPRAVNVQLLVRSEPCTPTIAIGPVHDTVAEPSTGQCMRSTTETVSRCARHRRVGCIVAGCVVGGCIVALVLVMLYVRRRRSGHPGRQDT